MRPAATDVRAETTVRAKTPPGWFWGALAFVLVYSPVLTALTLQIFISPNNKTAAIALMCLQLLIALIAAFCAPLLDLSRWSAFWNFIYPRGRQVRVALGSGRRAADLPPSHLVLVSVISHRDFGPAKR